MSKKHLNEIVDYLLNKMSGRYTGQINIEVNFKNGNIGNKDAFIDMHKVKKNARENMSKVDIKKK